MHRRTGRFYETKAKPISIKYCFSSKITTINVWYLNEYISEQRQQVTILLKLIEFMILKLLL